MRLINRLILALACAGVLAAAAPPASAAEQGRGRGQVNKAQKQKDNKDKGNKSDNRGDVERTRFEGLDRDGDGVVTRAEWRGNDQSCTLND